MTRRSFYRPRPFPTTIEPETSARTPIDDAFITSLYFEAEQPRGGQELPFDLDGALQRFSAWLDSQAAPGALSSPSRPRPGARQSWPPVTALTGTMVRGVTRHIHRPLRLRDEPAFASPFLRSPQVAGSGRFRASMSIRDRWPLAALAVAAIAVMVAIVGPAAPARPRGDHSATLATGSVLPPPLGRSSDSSGAGSSSTSGSSTGGPPKGGSAASLRTSCAAVAHIGDSTSDGLVSPEYLPNPAKRIAAQYHDVGVGSVRWDISGARSVVEVLPGQVNGYDAAQAIYRGGFRGCWVIALGTNDTADVAVGSNVGLMTRIQRMMAAAHGEPVMWVNLRSLLAGGPYSEANMVTWDNTLLKACARYPNMRVFNWAALAKTKWYISDGIHFTSAGYAARGRLIAQALARAFPKTGRSSGCVVS